MERLLEENAGCFRWLALAIAVGLVLRFLYDLTGSCAATDKSELSEAIATAIGGHSYHYILTKVEQGPQPVAAGLTS